MKKYKIYYGLGGGFGGYENGECDIVEANNLDEAERMAYDSACEYYESYAGTNGLREVGEIMEEDEVDEEEAEEIYIQEMEDWLDYHAELCTEIDEDLDKMIEKEYSNKEWDRVEKIADEFCGGMYKVLKEKEGERFLISQRTASSKDVEEQKLRATLSGEGNDYYNFREGTYTRLIDKHGFRDIVMSDTPMEINTNMDFLYNAHGKVLIGGLGLGIMLKILEKLNSVESVTVIEKNKEVIDLVWNQLNLPENFQVINADIFEYEPNEKYDTIYFDIWTNICGDNYTDMLQLEKKYKEFLDMTKPNWWLGHWRKVDCMRLTR